MSAQGMWKVVNQLTEPPTEVFIPVQPTIKALLSALEPHCQLEAGRKEYILTDFSTDLKSDADVPKFPPGATIWVLDAKRDLPPAKERIAFPPHPKTLTHAGDYEYFAAQGRAPFPYALAELIDNSLRATIRGRETSRKIIISFVLSSTSKPSSGLISVWDNGCGMTKQELNEWAVMNLSMEDRGTKPAEGAVQRGDKPAPGASRFLSGNLSYFGVGSKNAAFYLGKRIKVATRRSDSSYVHELCIGASDLEQRYKDGEAVYEEDLVHRQPGDARTTSGFERSFPVTQTWVAQEKAPASDQTSFTRILIGELKPEVLPLIGSMAGRQQLCKSLAHLYHYYLHGEKGNVGGASQSSKPDTPHILMEGIVGGRQIWSCDLAEEGGDLESLYLQAKQSEFHFSLDVPSKGQIEGVLWYFPFQNERETLPTEEFHLGHDPVTHYNMTQQQHLTQAPATQHPQVQGEAGSDEESDIPLWQRSKAPLFEAFWQGRLIPGARIESLPFIEAVRNKRGAAVKDVIPDECFLRLRGALFFGPGFLVTRNKLTFRDNLQELLTSATKKERVQDKLFKEWMTKCHSDLDKVIRFESLASDELQAEARKQVGQDISAFERITGGSLRAQRGDLVRLAVKPSLVGRVEYFVVSLDVKEEGVYANGQVTVQPLPMEVHGSQARKTYPLRRIDAVLEATEAERHLSKELQKVPSVITIVPGQLDDVPAGQDLPDTAARILNGAGQRVVKGHLGGKKVNFSIIQQLWYCPEGPDASTEVEADGEGEGEKENQPTKQPRRKKLRQGKSADSSTSRERLQPPAPKAELLNEAENSKPSSDAFEFAGGTGLERAGTYILRYVMTPSRPAAGMLKASIRFNVAPGPATEMILQGEGRAAMATQDLMLGEWLPDINLLFKDAYGNTTMTGVDLDQHQTCIRILKAAGEEGAANEEVQDMEVFCSQVLSGDGSSISLNQFQIFGPSDFKPGTGPLCVFSQQDPASITEGCAQREEGSDASMGLMREIRIHFSWPGLPPHIVPLRVLPGLPRTLALLPGHPFSGDDGMAAAKIATASTLPDIQVVALDQWENPTGPCPEMSFELVVASEALAPPKKSFQFQPRALVTGMKTVRPQAKTAGGPLNPLSVPLTCRLQFKGVEDASAQAVIGGDELPCLRLALDLQPSSAPQAIVLLQGDKEVPIQVDPETQERFAVFEGVAAGSQLKKLAIKCVDEGGRVVDTGLAGKVQVDWSRGSKKTRLRDEAIQLPELQAQEQVQEGPPRHWVRFTGSGGISLELAVRLVVVAAEPHSWTAEAVDGESGTQGIDAKGNVVCGKFFRLGIGVLDAFNNRCCDAISSSVPTPCIVPEAASCDCELKYTVSEWEAGWVNKADGNAVYEVLMRIGGDPGPVHLNVRDAGGEGGESRLQTDRLEVTLLPGNASCLMFDAPPELHCGTSDTLGDLRIKALDEYDNVAADSIEVVLKPSAVAVDGSGQAASVTAAAGNKVRTKEGVGVFKNVRMSAEQAGSYILKAMPTSREVTGEASLTVRMEEVNAVTAISLQLPEALLEEGLPAGAETVVTVVHTTKDGQPLPADTAAEGMKVKMAVPRAGRHGSLVLQPAEFSGGCAYSTGQLKLAGQYTFTAEYTETRPELAPAKKRRAIHATAVALDIKPGPCCVLVLESKTQPERLTATNGSASRERLLLKSAVVQLQDRHGNAVEQEGVPVAVSIGFLGDDGNPDGKLPDLELESAVQRTDERGRAIFGDVLVAEGTGRVAAQEGPECAAMELELRFSVEDSTGDEVKGWTCAVLFVEDAARFSALQDLNKQQQELLAQKEELNKRLESARNNAAEAASHYQEACKAVQARQKEVEGKPDSIAEVEAALKQIRQPEAAAEPNTSLEARYGAKEQPMTKSLSKCLQAGIPGILGVFAQLATVEDEGLSRVLAAAYRSMMSVLIVETRECRQQLEALLTEQRMATPDMLCMTHTLAYSGGGAHTVTPGSELARTLQQSACKGSDPPLPIVLPHCKATRSGGRGGTATCGAGDWPAGFLGHAANLVRPVCKGHRAALVQPLMGGTLVFETLKDADAYREHCTQVLKQGVPDILTLDLRRISSKGVISGSNFRVPPLADATIRFGSPAPQQALRATQAAIDVASIELLLEALNERDGAERQLDLAEQEKEEARSECEEELIAVDCQIKDIGAQLTSQPQGGRKRLSSSQVRRSEIDLENEEPVASKPAKKRRMARARR